VTVNCRFQVDVFEVDLLADADLDVLDIWCDCDHDGDDRCRHGDAVAAAWIMAKDGGCARIHRRLYDALRKERVTWVSGSRQLDKDDWLTATDGKMSVGSVEAV
jgi:hypothetical protein